LYDGEGRAVIEGVRQIQLPITQQGGKVPRTPLAHCVYLLAIPILGSLLALSN
jgi:hypothetical protein